MSDMKIPNKIRFEYHNEKNVTLEYAHGVWGGINTNGEIEINFYTEEDKIPECAERYIQPNGTFSPEVTHYSDENSRTIIRNINNRILLNHQAAIALYNWLGDKLESLEAEEMRFNADINSNNREQ